MAGIFSITGYLGINFVLVLVRSFGALLAVTGEWLVLSFLCLRLFLVLNLHAERKKRVPVICPICDELVEDSIPPKRKGTTPFL